MKVVVTGTRGIPNIMGSVEVFSRFAEMRH